MTDNFKKLTDGEKKEIIKSRYSDSELFKRILDLTVKKKWRKIPIAEKF